jgi:hypothetical protein
MGDGRARAAGVVEGGAGLFERAEVEAVVQGDEQGVGVTPEKLVVDVIAEPDQQWREVEVDPRAEEVG